jgi:hypothetical protein
MAIRTWNGLGWKATMGLWNLEIKGLVELDSKNRLRMHDHLPDLGRDIANKKKCDLMEKKLQACHDSLWHPFLICFSCHMSK